MLQISFACENLANVSRRLVRGAEGKVFHRKVRYEKPMKYGDFSGHLGINQYSMVEKSKKCTNFAML